MRPVRIALLAVALALGACGSARAPGETTPSEATSVTLVEDRPVPIPGTDLVATLRLVEPERPREELPDGFVERQRARAWLELAAGETVERVRWEVGVHDVGGRPLRLTITDDGAARLDLEP